jgi:hypothetical protein
MNNALDGQLVNSPILDFEDVQISDTQISLHSLLSSLFW